MSESKDTSQEKTEEATPRKLEKASEEGQIARSKELNTAATVITGCAALLFFGGHLAGTMMGIFKRSFSVSYDDLIAEDAMLLHLQYAAFKALEAAAPFFVFLLIAAFAAPMLMGGWNFSTKALEFKLNRLSPMAGLKRMFSANALMELVKALLKFFLLALVTVLILSHFKGEFLSLDDGSFEQSIIQSTHLVTFAALLLSMGLLIVAGIDVPFQLWQNSEKLKMTKQEVRDEMKEVEGKPEVKGRIRQLQREIAQRRMMAAVPEADVIITNPTHYSVALKYDMVGSGAPILVAKGADLVALKIREIASLHQVEIIEAPPLARAIYHSVELEEEVPSGLYLAVAQVLAYVFQLKTYQEGQGQKPIKPEDIEVPVDFRFD